MADVRLGEFETRIYAYKLFFFFFFPLNSQDKFAVCEDNIPYLAGEIAFSIISKKLLTCLTVISSTALLPVSEDIRNRLKLDAPDSPSIASPSGKLEHGPGSTVSVDSQVSIVITPSPSTPPVGSPLSEQEAFVWPSQCHFLLLDPGIVNDHYTQALLLTTLVSITSKLNCRLSAC